MNVLIAFLQIAGATMLLLYSVRMVRTGVERAAGPAFRIALEKRRSNHASALLLGVIAAVCLQGSTSVLLLASSFAAGGLLVLSSALALVLGADIGSSLVVQLLTLKTGWLVPVLLVAGGSMFLGTERRTVRQTGRILLGVAFVLISLKMIGEATSALKTTPIVPQIARLLEDDAVAAYVFGAVFAFAMHSTVATVLLIASLLTQGVVGMEAAVALLLGANLGGGFIGVWLTRASAREGRIIATGNLAFRAAGTLAALCTLVYADLAFEAFGDSSLRQFVNIHVAFNVAMAMACFPFVRIVARLLDHAFADGGKQNASAGWQRPASALVHSGQATPQQALASATREVLHMGQLLEIMLRPVMDMFKNADRTEIDKLIRLDREVNATYSAIKIFVAHTNRGQKQSGNSELGVDIANYAINLERVGDIAKQLLDLAWEKNRKRQEFSADGWQELIELHSRVLANMQLSLNLMISGDIESARRLIKEKDSMRVLERESRLSHMARLENGNPESLSSSNLHLEVIRCFREINSLFAAAAFPILSRNGQLRESRLMKAKKSGSR